MICSVHCISLSAICVVVRTSSVVQAGPVRHVRQSVCLSCLSQSLGSLGARCDQTLWHDTHSVAGQRAAAPDNELGNYEPHIQSQAHTALHPAYVRTIAGVHARTHVHA